MRAHHAGPRLRAMESTPLSVSNPELAAQASGWDPTTLSAGSHRRVEWICERQHVWSANVKDRARGAGCRWQGAQAGRGPTRSPCRARRAGFRTVQMAGRAGRQGASSGGGQTP